jgi:hypothetical protein
MLLLRVLLGGGAHILKSSLVSIEPAHILKSSLYGGYRLPVSVLRH